jgi:hypothetical protein
MVCGIFQIGILHMYKFDENALCLDMDTNLFFDKYEEIDSVASTVDSLCIRCPAQRQCLAYAVSNQEWGVWGGIYFENGKISREFNSHKTKEDWFAVWSGAVMEND